MRYIVCIFTDLLEVGLRQARRKAAKCCDMGGGAAGRGKCLCGVCHAVSYKQNNAAKRL